MAPPAERRKAAQSLRKMAKKYDVERVEDSAGKKKITDMCATILALGGLMEEDRIETETLLAAFLATFGPAPAPEPEPVAAAAEAEVAEEKPDKIWCFKAVQLTYNCTQGDGISTDASVLASLFERLRAFGEQLVTVLSATGISITLEESLQTGTHVHAHMYLHFAKQFRKQGPEALSAFVFEEIRPHLVPNKASGRDFDGAVRNGHFYVWYQKLGTLHVWTTYEPWVRYGVEAWWIDNLLKQRKFSRSVYLEYAAKINIGFQSCLQNIRAAERYERLAAVEAHVAKERAKVTSLLKPCKTFPEIDDFVSRFGDTGALRRPILAIVGGTNLGKRLLAASVLRHVGDRLGIKDFLEVTVEGQSDLDFSDFDHQIHSGVLLDGVGDTQTLQQNREILQGRPKMAKGGQSATNIYSYPFCLANRAVVATFDMSAKNLEAFTTNHWLSESRNVIQLRLNEKAWVE